VQIQEHVPVMVLEVIRVHALLHGPAQLVQQKASSLIFGFQIYSLKSIEKNDGQPQLL